MKHYEFRFNKTQELLLTLDAEDISQADQIFKKKLGFSPESRGITVSFISKEVPDERCNQIHQKANPQTLKKIREEINRRAIKQKTKKETTMPVEKRPQTNNCFYCGEETLPVPKRQNQPHPLQTRSMDHIHPKSLGGRKKVLACQKCNLDKRNMTLEEYRVVIALRRGLIGEEILRKVRFYGETNGMETSGPNDQRDPDQAKERLSDIISNGPGEDNMGRTASAND